MHYELKKKKKQKHQDFPKSESNIKEALSTYIHIIHTYYVHKSAVSNLIRNEVQLPGFIWRRINKFHAPYSPDISQVG